MCTRLKAKSIYRLKYAVLCSCSNSPSAQMQSINIYGIWPGIFKSESAKKKKLLGADIEKLKLIASCV